MDIVRIHNFWLSGYALMLSGILRSCLLIKFVLVRIYLAQIISFLLKFWCLWKKFMLVWIGNPKSILQEDSLILCHNEAFWLWTYAQWGQRLNFLIKVNIGWNILSCLVYIFLFGFKFVRIEKWLKSFSSIIL